MPKTPIDYSKCVMYRIVCKDVSITDCYVGHTTNLKKRKCQHKSDYKQIGDRKVYKFIREHGAFENWSIVQIEEYSCDTYEHAVMRERYWIEHYKATLNSAQIRTRKPCDNCGSFFCYTEGDMDCFNCKAQWRYLTPLFFYL
jgi:predicted GIY-YIG superfamily endonuclease